MKTEIITMCKYTSGGNIRYDFPPEKRNTMHDDRVFVYGLLCWFLAQLRKGQLVQSPKNNTPSAIPSMARRPSIVRSY